MELKGVSVKVCNVYFETYRLKILSENPSLKILYNIFVKIREVIYDGLTVR